MKITDVKVVPVNSFLYVKIFTDEGIVGVGESGDWGFLLSSGEAVKSFKTYLIGQDPLQIEHHWQYMYRCFHFRGAAVMSAISAIDIALWDIAGKYYGVPVYKLLGGKCRDKVRVYYHVSGSTTEELVQSCVEAKKLGYNAVGHLSPFLDEPRSKRYYESYTNMITSAVDRVAKIREAVGNDMDLCLEMHRRLKPGEAIAFGHAVEQYNPFFLEDPCTPDNFDSMALIANRINIPVATGERLNTPQEFAMLLKRNALAYARTSVCMCGGITGARKIAALAEAYNVMIVPHNPLSPISTAACLQVAASVENCAIQELPDHSTLSATERYTSSNKIVNNSFKQSDMVTWVPKVDKGFCELPTTPGIGCDLVEGVEEKYQFNRRTINTRLHVDGSIVDQ
ncbi:mandelate racemase/muconate lactonizing enzyme family protein [Acidaminococcus fermentans]|uniref:mandelate racemase/muconate lactonizing enzyme family protein n=1 Tax=Acidaminococcus fermentans TaxID=905 RepID=UPI002E78D74E|nr:mandelate racemase/muconate lactonizing enzyme family protein [Acidaminococcus fermentans]MEE1597443.1 mandelate racemase/muconate lactonizing enzyme family protein [Acidaminococcus fermentans]MEE4121707.1 mandelate racemase/muconate lactonizing enzyme family protein [Acidaminococcus fermentans]